MTTQKITKYLKLPFLFDKKKLAQDLLMMLESQWVPHFNTDGYEGNWKAIPLYAHKGDANNIFALTHEASEIIETSIMKNCDYFKEVVNRFKCPLISVRILRLEVGASIKPHRDYQLGYEDHNFRLHIPISTNDQVRFILDGELLKMNPGECWYTNVNYIHSVSNNGITDRVHLVIDGERNAWSDTLFFSLAPEESFILKDETKHSEETLNRMIEELKHLDEPAAASLLHELLEQQKTLKSNDEI